MSKMTIAEQIEIKRDGTVQVRFAKQRMNDDGTPDGEPQWHRTSFDPDADIDAQMSVINAHLASMGEAHLESDCLSRIKAHASVARTPEKVAACVERKAAIAEEQAEINRIAEAEQAKAKAAEEARFDAAVANAVARVQVETKG